MSTTQREYEALYRWLKSEGVEETIKSISNAHIRTELIRTIAVLPHPAVASNRDIQRTCVLVQEGLFEIFATEEIALDESQEEYIQFKQLTERLEDKAAEAVEEPLDEKLDRIEGLLDKLNQTAGDTKRRVGDVNNQTSEMTSMVNHHAVELKDMLSTTQNKVDQTLKSNCPECSGDLRVYPHRGSGDEAELRLGCRSCEYEQYHITSSFLIEEGKAPRIPVESIGPIDVDWWISEIEGEARTLRSVIFRYDGREIAAMMILTVIGLIAAGSYWANMSYYWSLIGVILTMGGLIAGPTAWEMLQRLQDPYHNRYQKAAITVIDRVGGQHKRQLKEIAMKHLDKVDESEPEADLEECAFELARACKWDASYLNE